MSPLAVMNLSVLVVVQSSKQKINVVVFISQSNMEKQNMIITLIQCFPNYKSGA